MIAGKGDNALFALNTSGEITFRELPNVKKAHNDYTIVLNEANSEITLSIRVMNDALAFGALYLANPDLPERFRSQAELNTPNPESFYTQDEQGYLDYPTL
ncbi:MAG: hypothetical protein JHC35_05850 [Sulfuricurvum sp.]|uniref:hypothetical protein n=1 Tax=Sulfuricurvum sp. TaxID=2025608 RepID=UPI0025D45290|nr:hypothetical protein [Sulfuricurvum sp.]MCI4406791.1 hypothetical protein [Sulfuricurvum sp.]